MDRTQSLSPPGRQSGQILKMVVWDIYRQPGEILCIVYGKSSGESRGNPLWRVQGKSSVESLGEILGRESRGNPMLRV